MAKSDKNNPIQQKVDNRRRTQDRSNEQQVRDELPSSVRSEIWGVCLIAIGVLFSISLYFVSTSPFGLFVSGVSFGIFGLAGFILPLAFIAIGIFQIACPGSDVVRRWIVFGVMILFTILTIINVNNSSYLPTSDIKLFEYYAEAYNLSKILHTQGGLIGALLAYPLSVFLGRAGTNVFLAAMLVILALIITRISLKKVGEGIGNSVRERAQRRRFETFDVEDDDGYDDDFEEEPMPSRREIRRMEKERRAEEQRQKEIERVRELRRRNRVKNGGMYTESIVADDENAVIESEVEVDPEFISSHGPIPTEDVDEEFDESEYDYDDDPEPIVPVVEKTTRQTAEPVQRKTEKRTVTEDFEVKPEAVDCVGYQRPPYTLLQYPPKKTAASQAVYDEEAKKLVAAFASFKVPVKVTNISVGPTITRYELQPGTGIKVGQVTTLVNDIALALAAKKIRVEAPIPGKSAIGIEVPSKSPSFVYLREILESPQFVNARSPLTFAIGKDISGQILTADLAKMPHLLVAGRTGAGKSVCLNSIILSFVYKSSPSDVRLILIDPKVVEFHVYESLKHLLVPIVDDRKKAASALRWAVSEMERRYKELSSVRARDIDRYNQLMTNPDDRMPKIVIVIDELAELMMTAAKEVEDSICRIAQLGRACGIHLIVATQRPSADIITGLIKSNIPTRIAFAVADPVNSRVILDKNGAESLLGDGDMLFSANGAPQPIRAQCAFVSNDEVEKFCDYFARTQTPPDFDSTIDKQITAGVTVSATIPTEDGTDDLLIDAVRIFFRNGSASASFLQRRLKIGYNRAARLVEEMEKKGIVSEQDGCKPRKLLIDAQQFESLFGVPLGFIPAAHGYGSDIDE